MGAKRQTLVFIIDLTYTYLLQLSFKAGINHYLSTKYKSHSPSAWLARYSVTNTKYKSHLLARYSVTNNIIINDCHSFGRHNLSLQTLKVSTLFNLRTFCGAL